MSGSRFTVQGSRFAILAILYPLFSILGVAYAQNPIIVYPAAGNLRAEQGTIELWFRFEEEPDGSGARSLHYFPFFFLHIEGEKQQRASFSYQTIWGTNHFHFFFSSVVRVQGDLMQSPYVATAEEGQTTKPDPRGPPIFTPRMHKGDWHYLAVTWTNGLANTTVGMHLDGRLVIRPTELPGMLWENLEATSLWLMNAPNHDNVAVDELRISDIAFTGTQASNSFARGAFVRDEHTLLLDHFDRIAENQTVAEQVAGYRGEKGGKLLNRCYEFVEGKAGKAIRLTVKEKQ